MLWVQLVSALCAVCTALILPNDHKIDKGSAFISGVGFLQSISWMHVAASGLVTVLEVIGIALNVPDGLLGATILAWGSCVGDLVTAIAVTRAGQPLMVSSVRSKS